MLFIVKPVGHDWGHTSGGIMKATPRPWHIRMRTTAMGPIPDTIVTDYGPVAKLLRLGTETVDRDNGTLIVTAVNTYDDVVAFFRRVRDPDRMTTDMADECQRILQRLGET